MPKTRNKVNVTTIRAIQWYLGCNKREAEVWLRSMNDSRIEVIVDGFTRFTKKSFYED